MPVPSSIVDLSTVAGSNSPQDSEVGSSSNGPDDYFRSGFGIQKRMFSAGSDLASASTLPLPAEGCFFNVTGTTAITGIATTYIGRYAFLSFQAATPLTNSANFKIPGGANYTTAAGDSALVVQTGSSAWSCLYLLKTDGTILGASDATAIANTALSTANTANSTANTAQTTANSAISQAGTAQSTANSAVATANSASSAASSATTTANSAASTANGAANSVAFLNGMLSTHTADNTRHLSTLSQHSGIHLSGVTITGIDVDAYGRVTGVQTSGGGVGGP